jgi:hypothetical protein
MIDNVFISRIPDALESWYDSPTALCNLIDQIVHPLTDDAPVVQLCHATTPGFRQTRAQFRLIKNAQRCVYKFIGSWRNQDMNIIIKRQTLDAFWR